MKKTPSRQNKSWPRLLLDVLTGTHVLFYLLPYMMVLLIAGTVAQKYVGLFTATHLFFSSFILWVGPVPLPGGASALTLLFVNLAAYFIVKSQWTETAIGSTLAHLGVIVLLLGGLVTLIDKQEGFIILRHGQPAEAFYDYHTRLFTIVKNGKEIRQIDADTLADGQTLRFDDIPFPIGIEKIYANSTIDDRNNLKALPARKEEETNQLGLAFTVEKNGKPQRFVVAEFLQQQPVFKSGDGVFRFTLKRASEKLPFSLRLNELIQDTYPGSDMAKAYETRFTVREKDHQWPAHVAMNDPLRYKGYTFYQASVLTLPNGEQASVFNAVKDAGWLFPYAATALVSVGLLINAWMKRHAKK